MTDYYTDFNDFGEMKSYPKSSVSKIRRGNNYLTLSFLFFNFVFLNKWNHKVL